MFENAHRPVMAPSLERQKLALWSAFVILLLVSLLAFYSLQQLISASQRIEHRQALLVEVTHFLSNLKDVETGARGYALSDGDQRHLQRHHDGTAAVRATSERLRTLSDEPQIAAALKQLYPLAEERIEAARRLMEQRSDQRATSANMVSGMQLMDRIRDRVADILAQQQAQYRAEREQLERQAWRTSIALAVGVVLCLLTIAWLFTMRGREVEQRRQLEEELRALNLELEDRIEERTAEVKRTSDLLNAVVENLPDMILLKEPSEGGHRYILINGAGEALLGRRRGDIIGKSEEDLFPADEAAAVRDANDSVIASGRARTFTDRKLTTASGVRTVETRMVPIPSGKGGQMMILGIVRDVSETRARDEQLRQLQRMDVIGRLTGGVAHDFNNLLAIIHGNSELIRERLKDGSDEAQMTDEVLGAADRGAELIRRLLAFSRMQHLAPEPVDLNAQLSSVLPLLQRSLGERIHIRTKPAKSLWPASVDPTQVDDAVVNLAINARDAMPGGGALTIETANVTLDEDYAAHHVEVTPGDYVMLAVSDTGIGMSADVVDRAFEPFFTTKKEGQGTGLGLSQVFGWVKQSGGHIKLYSEVGHGTTIKLYLPRSDASVEERAPAAECETPRGNDETILVVEDNPNVRKTVLRQLHELGYKTIEADGGSAALEMVRDGLSFDLLMTDVIMPGGITGYELSDQLRVARPDLRVLLTSGYTELAAAGDQRPRHDPLLSKPYRKRDLAHFVRSALDNGS